MSTADLTCSNGWGVTAVDSLSTAIIMGETDIVDQILDFVPKIDFTTTAKVNETISVFESNIRYIGGLLSGKPHCPLHMAECLDTNTLARVHCC